MIAIDWVVSTHNIIFLKQNKFESAEIYFKRNPLKSKDIPTRFSHTSLKNICCTCTYHISKNDSPFNEQTKTLNWYLYQYDEIELNRLWLAMIILHPTNMIKIKHYFFERWIRSAYAKYMEKEQERIWNFVFRHIYAILWLIRD